MVTLNGITATKYAHYFGQDQLPRFAPHLHIFGEAGTVKTGKDGKVGKRGETIIFVG